jgi:hypothetical protein
MTRRPPGLAQRPPLKLAALASRAFARRLRAGRRGRAPWRALALRWRRALPRSAAAPAAGPSARVHVWLAQIDLRFSTFASALPAAAMSPRRGTGRAPRAGGATALRRHAAVLQQRRPSRSDLHPRGGRVGARRFESLALQPAAPAREQPSAFPVRKLRLGLASPLLHRPGHTAARTGDAHRPPAATAARTLYYVRASRGGAPAGGAPRADRSARERRAHLPAMMVWRKSARAENAPEAARDFASAAPAARPDVAPARAALPALASAAGPREPTLAAALDPALADRLADDIIRRVERRVRIERERRGV